MKRIIPLVLVSFAGCIGDPKNPTTQPVTEISARETAEPQYWLDQPAVASASSSAFEPLVKSSEDILRDYNFALDRVDYRSGLITTEPRIASQFFEAWRRDNQTAESVAESSLGTFRRTIRVEIRKDDAGKFVAEPKVLVERQALAEKRITGAMSSRAVYRAGDPKVQPSGSKELDRGIAIPRKYWYAVGRDTSLEKRLAKDIQREVKGKQ